MSRERTTPVAPPARIRTARLSIEPLRPGHARALYAALRDPRIYDYVPGEPAPSARAVAVRIRRLARGPPVGSGQRWLNWVVRRRGSGRVIGTLQATVRADRHRAWIAYLFAPTYWGHGYASESLAALLTSLRTRDGLATFEARVDARNSRSIRLLRRVGFERVRTRRHAEFLHGAWGDEHLFRLRLPDPVPRAAQRRPGRARRSGRPRRDPNQGV